MIQWKRHVRVCVLSIGLSATPLIFAHPPITGTSLPSTIIERLIHHNPSLSKAALLAGIRAYQRLRLVGKDLQRYLTIVDFSRPSRQKRLWVLNMATGQTDYFTYVAQGQDTHHHRAFSFSNMVGSLESSIGVYLTGKPYYGIAGYSLRLHGLDRGFNNHAYKRGIVMHPSRAVSAQFVKQHHRVGRTYGCFGINTTIAHSLIERIKNGTVMVAYYPAHHWLTHSWYEQPMLH